MLFSTAIFLFLFLPIVLGLYYLLPKKGRNAFLLFASLFFYTWGEFELVLVMLTSVVTDYVAALQIEAGKRKLGLFLSLGINIGLLSFFKYGNFAYDNYLAFLEIIGVNDDSITQIPEIALPLGISFYTFQTLSYTLDVYWGKVKATRNFIDFAAYVTLFPQLIAGPIIRYRDVHTQLISRKENSQRFVEGIDRFIVGLGKKVLIANTLGTVANAAFEQTPGDLSFGLAWLGLFAYAFQLYYDFSGYSDMAIGLGKMFGFDFLENFNYPYISKSVQEYWRRWHISLSTWFRDYVYFPMGGNRRKVARVYFNLVFIFVLVGFWHGAHWSFIIFGLYHGFFMIIERQVRDKKRSKAIERLGHLYFIWMILMSYVIFRVESFGEAGAYFSALYGVNGTDIIGVHPFLNLEILIIFVLAIVFCMPTHQWLKHQIRLLFQEKKASLNILDWAYKALLIFILALSASYLASDTYNPFIYFRF